MALVRMSELLNRARDKGIGCGAFSVYSMEAVMGAAMAARDKNTPIIMQLAESRFKMAPLELVGPMMLNTAKESEVDIAVHLDHGSSMDTIKKALEMGFTSVMYDGSALQIEENIENTKIVKEMAFPFEADVEAELGLVGRSEDGEQDYGIQCTRPEDAHFFALSTNTEALAVAIGNQHGNYSRPPSLRFDILKEIHNKIPNEHLVLHGGSGITDEDFQECIRNGITKINIATAILNGITAEATEYLREFPYGNYGELNRRMVRGAYEVVCHHIDVFNMNLRGGL
jgi:fructose-bisphosphate aldolase class II